MKHDYCEGTAEEKEEWIIKHIKVEFRNGYREVVGLPIDKKDPMPKGKKE